jgi:hypothetical protein
LTYHFDGTETFHFEAGEVRSTVACDGDKLAVSVRQKHPLAACRQIPLTALELIAARTEFVNR